MRIGLLRRLKVLEKRGAEELEAAKKKQEAAKKNLFNQTESLVLLAYQLGGLKSGESPFTALARALLYDNEHDYCEDFGDLLRTGYSSQLKKRFDDAYSRLYEQVCCFNAMGTQQGGSDLPAEWINWINQSVERGLGLENEVDDWTMLQVMALAVEEMK